MWVVLEQHAQFTFLGGKEMLEYSDWQGYKVSSDDDSFHIWLALSLARPSLSCSEDHIRHITVFTSVLLNDRLVQRQIKKILWRYGDFN